MISVSASHVALGTRNYDNGNRSRSDRGPYSVKVTETARWYFNTRDREKSLKTTYFSLIVSIILLNLSTFYYDAHVAPDAINDVVTYVKSYEKIIQIISRHKNEGTF